MGLDPPADKPFIKKRVPGGHDKYVGRHYHIARKIKRDRAYKDQARTAKDEVRSAIEDNA
jgi:hypothetical protein